ncbi:TetR/AcrR family transcriptional regulator [Microbacterium sp. NPDC077663]|uniref:TetR/AcrR family transcriptional regulator n=1 Tax=Microbacterium sp. NPDC077663 TaxID=3364189 RepID=UPI0037CA0C45
MRERRNSAQGRESRELILQTALEVIGRRGYGATSLRDIAAEVGMTQAGMLHHFGTKENLLVEVLRERDVATREALTEQDGDEPPSVRVARRNAETPALVHLYTSLQSAASAADHPARVFFEERQRSVHAVVAADIRSRQDAGEMSSGLDADTAATVLLALSDGLQLQQGVDPSIDIAAVLAWTWERIAAAN